MRPFLYLLASLTAVVWLGCTSDAEETPEAAVHPQVVVLASPSADGSGMPQLTAGPDATLWLSWIEPADSGHALRYARLAPSAAGWSSPETVARGVDWFVNWADVPALSVAETGRFTAHWLRKSGADPYAYDVVVRRGGNGAAAASAPSILHDDTRPAEHGFASHVPVGADSTLLLWLDGRAYADGREAMTLRARYLAADGEPGPELLLDDRTCDCCPTAAARLDDGSVLAVYRDRTDGEVRDIAAVRIRGTTVEGPVAVQADGWEIAGCPVNGPALDAAGQTVAVAWFTGAQETPRVLAAFSEDGGSAFGEAVRVDEGMPVGRVAVAALPDGAAVAWVERDPAGGTAGLLVRRVYPDGRLGPALRVADTTPARASGFPRMVRQGERLVFAWTRQDAGVRTAYLPISALGASAGASDG